MESLHPGLRLVRMQPALAQLEDASHAASQAQRVRDYYARALGLLPEADRYAQRSGLIMAAIYQTLLDEIEADGFQVLQQRIRLTPLNKLWIAWSTARRERRRHRRILKKHAHA